MSFPSIITIGIFGVIGIGVVTWIYRDTIRLFKDKIDDLPIRLKLLVCSGIVLVSYSIFILLFSYFLASTYHKTDTTTALIWLALVSILLTGGFLGILLYGMANKTLDFLDELKKAIRSIKSGQRSVPLDAESGDEFSEVSEEFNEMADSLKENQQMTSDLTRYVPKSIEQSIKQGESPFDSESRERRTCSVMFADIRNFSYLSQTIPDEELIGHLNDYFQIVVEEVHSTDGIIDKFVGDAVLAVWGDTEFTWSGSESRTDYTFRAVQTAQKIQNRVYRYNKNSSNKSQNLSFGIGIATGDVLTGNVGTRSRADWTVIGKDVNLSSRISNTAMPYRVLLSAKTSYSLDQRFDTRELESMTLKGFERPITLYALLWHNGRSGPLMVEDDFKDGWYRYSDEDDGREGPLHINDLLDRDDFDPDSLVFHETFDDWSPWIEAARNLRLWMIKTSSGISGPFTFEDVMKRNSEIEADIDIQVRGQREWRSLHYFLEKLE